MTLAALSVHAQEPHPAEEYFVVDIELQTAAELQQLLDRAEQFLEQGENLPVDAAKLTLVLHGPVLRSLLRDNYQQNKTLVTQAASLSALEVIDVKACKSWMTGNSLDPDDLQPFVEVVPYGPAEVEQLVKEQGYLYF